MLQKLLVCLHENLTLSSSFPNIHPYLVEIGMIARLAALARPQPSVQLWSRALVALADVAGNLTIAGNGPELTTIEPLARAFEKANPRALSRCRVGRQFETC